MKAREINHIVLFFLLGFSSVGLSQNMEDCQCSKDSSGIFIEVCNEISYHGSNENLIKLINNFESTNDTENKMTAPQSKLRIESIVDTNGVLHPQRINGKEMSDDLSLLEREYVNYLLRLPRLTPATCKMEKVTSRLNFTIYIDLRE